MTNPDKEASPGAEPAASPSTRPRPSGGTDARPSMDLSKIRHDLRTPINHILGYCEMLQEDEHLPEAFAPDLARIHAGGRQLLALIAEYFDEETFHANRRDVHRLEHDLRTPVNQIIGYSEIILEQAEELARDEYLTDLGKIRDAAALWLGLMEEHLLPTGLDEMADHPPSGMGTGALAPGIMFQAPAARPAELVPAVSGRLLVVDDDESNRDILCRRLRRDGYTVELAASGLEALRLLRASRFDLVLLDLMMPGLDGYQVLAKMKAESALREIPVIMLSAMDQEAGIARCIELGAEDFVPKPFSPVFLRARLGACLEKKRLLDKERQTHQALLTSQERLAAELAEAAVYVRSLLPAPLDDEVQVRWRFQPCAELGGDIFGYHWIDRDHLALYLLDVSGHGMGAALLSVSLFNVLRSQSLQYADFGDPGSVLRQLNRVFPMERHNNLLFTMWYGVFNRATRQLTYASGGHPPAVLIESASLTLQQLSTAGRVLGCDPEAEYRNASCRVEPGSRLYVYSDGAYEIERPDGSTAQLTDLLQALGTPTPAGIAKLDALMTWAANVGKQDTFDDDVSILEIAF